MLKKYLEDNTISFIGYKEFLNDYKNLMNYDLDEIYRVKKNALLWSDYISEILNFVKFAIKQSDEEKNIKLMIFSKKLEIQHKKCINIYYNCNKLMNKTFAI